MTASIGLGLAALGRPAYINLGHAADVGDPSVEGMERAAHAVLDAAYGGGVRAFDAARSYGHAEAFLGHWLADRGLGRDDVAVSSKWGYTYTGGWRVDAAEHEVKDLSAGQLRRQWRETRDLLGDRLGLYQIHSATLESGVLEDREVRAALEDVRAAGVRVGLTVTGPRPGRHDRARARGRRLRRRPGDVEPARARRGGRAGAGARGRPAGARQGGARQRPPDVRAARRRSSSRRPASATRRRTPSRSPRRSRGRGRTSCSRARPAWPSSTSNLAARDVGWDEELERRLAGLAREAPPPTGTTRSELPWN